MGTALRGSLEGIGMRRVVSSCRNAAKWVGLSGAGASGGICGFRAGAMSLRLARMRSFVVAYGSQMCSAGNQVMVSQIRSACVLMI